jgi:hypothetical protein
MTNSLRYRCNPAVTTHLVDGDVFLVTPTTIKHLNATAAVIWLTIEDPSTRRDIFGILREVFATASPRQLGRDLNRFLRNCIAEGLIVTAQGQSARKTAK